VLQPNNAVAIEFTDAHQLSRADVRHTSPPRRPLCAAAPGSHRLHYPEAHCPDWGVGCPDPRSGSAWSSACDVTMAAQASR
jgi:hypothetical protein